MKHNAVPIGGMATALPHRDQAVNEEAAATVRGDKTWEAEQGFLRGWVAHIYHMKSAGRSLQRTPQQRLGTIRRHGKPRQLPGQHRDSRKVQ